MKILFVTVGISGSGKTVLSEQVAKILNIDHHSSDAIRGEICGDETDQSKNGLVFKILHERIDKSLSKGRGVIADTTALTPKTRKEFRQLALKHQAKTVALVMTTRPEDAIKYNNARERVVPEHVIHNQLGKFVAPTTSEFNEVFYVNWQDDMVTDSEHSNLYSINEFINNYVQQ